MKREFRDLLLIAGVALSGGIAFDVLIYRAIPGISFPIYMGFILGASLLLARRFQLRTDVETILLAVLAFIISLMVFIRTSELLIAMDILVSLYLFTLLLTRFTGFSLKEFKVFDYVSQFVKALWRSAKESFLAGWDLLDSADELKGNKTVGQVGRGIVITLPALFVFAALFASADLVFSKYISNLTDLILRLDFFKHAVVIYITAGALMGMFAYAFYRQQNSKLNGGLPKSDQEPEEFTVADKPRTLSVVESSILLGSINALFAFFIFLQLAYLFGGKQNIAGQGFTYAEYAHRGFFELIMVALLSFLVIWITEAKTNMRSRKHALIFKSLASGLIGLVALVMVSAFMRLSIYEAVYGYTILRVYTQVFIVMLGVIAIALLYKIIMARSETWFSLRVFSIAVAFFLGINFVNMDATIAQLSIKQYKETNNRDLLVYIWRDLSDDAILEKLYAYDHMDNTTRDYVADGEYSRWGPTEHLDSLNNMAWQSYNLARSSALKQLRHWEVELDGKSGKN